MSKKYTEEFQKECVSYLSTENLSIRKGAKALGVSESALRDWNKKYGVVVGSGMALSEKDELALLRKEVKRLRAEKDILKKAAAYFAKESE